MVRFRPVGRCLDALLAVAVTVGGQLEVWSGVVVGGPRPTVAVIVAVGTLALAFRRRAPMAVLVATCGASSALGLLGVDSNSASVPVLAAFVAIGTAAFHARRSVLALPVALLLIWPAVLLDKGFVTQDLLYVAVLVGLAWSVGRAQRSAPCARNWPRNAPSPRSRRNGCESRGNCTTSWRTASA